MSTHLNHFEKETFYFVTFTCYKWLPLIATTSLYDYLKEWAEQLAKRGVKLSGYVIMPNHIHLLVFVEDHCKQINVVIGEAKRFMAYEIVKRLKNLEEAALLQTLMTGVQPEERRKGKKHQIFRLSFDAQAVKGEDDICNVLDYIHHNPVSGKWQLADDYTEYPYSSARYYELGEQQDVVVWDYRTVGSESPADDSEGS